MPTMFKKVLNCPLFKGISEQDLPFLLSCLNARTAVFDKGSVVLNAGEIWKTCGIVIEGKTQVFQYDFLGSGSLIATIKPMQLFAEAFSCTGISAPITVEAAEKSEILFLNTSRIHTTCDRNCAFHARLIYNLLHIMALKNVALLQKIECMSQKTTREKLMTFLSMEAMKNQSSEFDIPYDRQGLADYLSVNRSALSVEISRLAKDGLIKCRKNRFKLSENSPRSFD
ncbi:MAG: Crp/Fnr family transcriptional regulator [Alphaproteobacteria bacterium]|nr:Crp/Fnr family transcriptional regulator [Alphaproteobacteria bacterium]